MASVVAEIDPVDVPPVRVNTTVDPPAVKLFPAASFAVKLRVTVDPEETVPLETEMTDWVGEMPPGMTVTVGKLVDTEDPPMVAWSVVAVPDRTPVKVEV